MIDSKKQSMDWMRAVEVWVSNSGIEGVVKAFQLPKSWAQNVRIIQVVLSRHYAYALRGIVDGEHSAFSNWPQFFNTAQLTREKYKSPTLSDLFSVLQETQNKAVKITYLPEPITRWKVRELEFIITQEESSRT